VRQRNHGLSRWKIGTRVEELNKRRQVAKQRLPERLRRLLCSRSAKRGLFAMDFFQLDDSSISVIAMVAGMLGGYWINGQFQQLRARRAKVPAGRSLKK
jgi:hypothetical protein